MTQEGGKEAVFFLGQKNGTTLTICRWMGSTLGNPIIESPGFGPGHMQAAAFILPPMVRYFFDLG